MVLKHQNTGKGIGGGGGQTPGLGKGKFDQEGGFLESTPTYTIFSIREALVTLG